MEGEETKEALRSPAAATAANGNVSPKFVWYLVFAIIANFTYQLPSQN